MDRKNADNAGNVDLKRVIRKMFKSCVKLRIENVIFLIWL
jgi:hypothetical protein